MPGCCRPPRPPRRRLDTTGSGHCNFAWSYGGVPTITLPCGVAMDNLPVGMQIVAAHGGDDALLAIASWCGQVIAFDAEPPLVAEAD